ncbi:hypothetical protein BJ912DRAFT_972526 [Pholiota molesta]|nr:hypothetical protein BJ912DRAFT_972526 [Pholiota molesta]
MVTGRLLKCVHVECACPSEPLTMPPNSKLSVKCPMSRVPSDVLQEIFVHCLPQHPLNERQPNTTIAPMLLCQVCSAWRTVALASATLWCTCSIASPSTQTTWFPPLKPGKWKSSRTNGNFCSSGKRIKAR